MIGLMQAAAERRGRLLALSGQRRDAFARSLAPLDQTLALADGGLALIHALKAHPEWLALGAAGLMILRPLRSLRWLRGALLVWRLLPFLRGLARHSANAATQ